MKKIISFVLATILFAGVTSCKKEDDTQTSIVDLILSDNSLNITLSMPFEEVYITSGNGKYQVKSDNENIAEVEIANSSIIIKAINEGTTKITVTDSEGKTVVVDVTVTAAIPTFPMFVWDNLNIKFDSADKYGISILANQIAFTDLKMNERQYILSWDGGLSIGDKTNGKLVIVEANNESTINLTSVTVKQIQSGTSGNYITFNDGDKYGELYFIK